MSEPPAPEPPETDRSPPAPEPEPAEAPASRPVLTVVRAGSVIVLLALALGLGAAVSTCADRLACGPPPASSTTTIVRATPSVVVAVRDLARLTTAEAHVERVLDLRDRQSKLFGLVEAEDAILLVAAADVSAGVDLGSLGEDDVVIDETRRRVRITLPAPEVQSARLDNEHTYVHARSTDLLARRAEDLETRARQEAERTLRDAAVEAGLLDRARTNAERTVGSLVRSLGYEDVDIEWAD